MTSFILFLITLGAVVLFIRWRTHVSTQALLHHAVPETGDRLPQHPDGILLLFHHPRCGPCKQMVQQFEHIAARTTRRVLKINVGEQPELARAFGIRATPTTLFIKDNTVNQAFIGPVSLQKLERLLQLGD